MYSFKNKDFKKFDKDHENANELFKQYRNINNSMGLNMFCNEKISANFKLTTRGFGKVVGDEIENNYIGLVNFYYKNKDILVHNINIAINNEIDDKFSRDYDLTEIEVSEEDYLKVEDYEGNTLQVVIKLVYELIELSERLEIDLCEKKDGILFEPAYNFYLNEYDDSQELQNYVERRVNDFIQLVESNVNSF